MSKKTAIIGSGISGLGAAYLLHPKDTITVYEKESYIGGHSRTLEADTPIGPVPVDTGFIVFNYRNYPLLTGLFAHCDVPVEQSDMSFAASIGDGWLEYGTQSLRTLFAQKRNLARPRYWRMLRDILTFNREGVRYLASPGNLTLGAFIRTLGLSDWFRDYFILAIGGAIWSCPPHTMLNFPAASFLRFFQNHGLLTVNDQPQWYTVSGGSREYVRRVTAPFADRIFTNRGVARVTRDESGVEITDQQGHSARYDRVVFACHGDQALALLADADAREREILGAFRYQTNQIILHGDTSFMPKRRAAWASWVYLLEGMRDARPAISLSYWMNRLQNLDERAPLIVTLNPGREPDAGRVYNRHWFEHPIFDEGAIAAQQALPALQGHRHSYFCGAYTRYGFHEDGLMSGVHVAELLGAKVPWR